MFSLLEGHWRLWNSFSQNGQSYSTFRFDRCDKDTWALIWQLSLIICSNFHIHLFKQLTRQALGLSLVYNLLCIIISPSVCKGFATKLASLRPWFVLRSCRLIKRTFYLETLRPKLLKWLTVKVATKLWMTSTRWGRGLYSSKWEPNFGWKDIQDFLILWKDIGNYQCLRKVLTKKELPGKYYDQNFNKT